MIANTQTLRPRTPEDAPDVNRSTLDQIKKTFGFLPNMLATIGNSEAALQGYMALDAWYRKSSLDPVEREIVELVASLENGCDYCKAAHSTALVGFMHYSPDLLANVRNGQPTGNAKHDALIRVTHELVQNRGAVSGDALAAFYAQGYRPEQVLEINIGLALKVMSNYTDRAFGVEIDAPFQPLA